MAPAASSQLSPENDEALTTPSNSAATAVGAAGMKARNRLLSSPTVAGASTSSNRRKASVAPIPSSVMVRPSAAVSAAGLAVAPSGAPSASRRGDEAGGEIGDRPGLVVEAVHRRSVGAATTTARVAPAGAGSWTGLLRHAATSDNVHGSTLRA